MNAWNVTMYVYDVCVMLELCKGREENVENIEVFRTHPLSGFIRALSGFAKFLPSAQRLNESAQPKTLRK